MKERIRENSPTDAGFVQEEEGANWSQARWARVENLPHVEVAVTAFKRTGDAEEQTSGDQGGFQHSEETDYVLYLSSLSGSTLKSTHQFVISPLSLDITASPTTTSSVTSEKRKAEIKFVFLL